MDGSGQRVTSPGRTERQTMAFGAAAICGGATFLNFGEALLPGGPPVSIVPGLAAMVLTVLLVLVGPRLPVGWLFGFGPLGAVLIGVAVATTTTNGDSAILYMWPAIWTAYFFGVRGTVLIVVWIGVVHAVVLIALPPGIANVDRWLDVVVAVLIVATVVQVLAHQNRRLVERLASEARIDPLTGLLNRRGFDERVDVETVRAARDGTSTGLVSFDLDHFKLVNDQHGHEMGDRVLTWFAALVTEQTRAIDVVARLGGEEFVVLLPGADLADVEQLAERVRRCAALPPPERGSARFGVSDELELTVSGGIAACAPPVDPDALLEAADHALYSAKLLGRDQISAGARRVV